MNNETNTTSDETSDGLVERVNKTQVKREREEVKALGRQLTDLPAKHLQRLPLSESSYDAIVGAQGMKKGALKRQLQYISGLLLDEDNAALRRALDEVTQPHRQQVQAQHQLEQWRDALIAGENAVISELSEHFTDIDRQYLMQLVRNAHKEQKQDKPPKSSRLIFQYLKELQVKE